MSAPETLHSDRTDPVNTTHDLIVCVHNGLQDLVKCLGALIVHWTEQELRTLIIIDDASDAPTRHHLQRMREEHSFVELIHLKKQSYYTCAANIGLKSSDANIRTLLNSDTIVTTDWARAIRRTLSLSPMIGVVGPLSNAASTQSVPFVKGTRNQTAVNTLPPSVCVEVFSDFVRSVARPAVPPFVPLVHGFCYTITQDAYVELGGFDEELFPRGYGEENDFSFRAENAGFVLAIATDSFVYHAKSASYSPQERVAYMDSGMKALADKHGRARIRASVEFMEKNPFLQQIRTAVLERWRHHYKS